MLEAIVLPGCAVACRTDWPVIDRVFWEYNCELYRSGQPMLIPQGAAEQCNDLIGAWGADADNQTIGLRWPFLLGDGEDWCILVWPPSLAEAKTLSMASICWICESNHAPCISACWAYLLLNTVGQILIIMSYLLKWWTHRNGVITRILGWHAGTTASRW